MTESFQWVQDVTEVWDVRLSPTKSKMLNMGFYNFQYGKRLQ